MTKIQLAHALYEALKEKGVMTRSQMNTWFKAESDQHKAEQLTEVLKSMVVFEHVDRHLDTESNAVYFWLRGTPSRWPASTKILNSQGVFDWLKGEVRQGIDVPPKKTTPDLKHEVPSPQPFLEDTPRAASPASPPLLPATSSGGLLEMSKGVSLDVFLTRVAEKVPSFTPTDILQLEGVDVNPAVLALRLGTLCSKNVLEYGAPTRFIDRVPKPVLRKRFAYWKAGKPTPEGYTKLTAPEYVHRGGRKPKTPSAEAVQSFLADWESMLTTPDTGAEKASVKIVKDSPPPSLMSQREADASVSAAGRITLYRSTGEVDCLTVEESLAVLKLFSALNANALLDTVLRSN